MVRTVRSALASLVVFLLVLSFPSVPTTAATRIRIAAGPPISLSVWNGIAQLIMRDLPGVEATPEAVPGPGSELQLLGERRYDVASTGASRAWDALKGVGQFQGKPVALLALTPMMSAFLHLVTLEGTGINSVSDIRGKRVSVGTGLEEVSNIRALKALGIDPASDIRVERLGRDAAAVALREKRIDAFFVMERVPIAPVQELAATPGVRIKLIPLDAAVSALQREFGNTYYKATIQKEFYPGVTADVPTVGAAAVLVAHPELPGDLAYQITKLFYERRPGLAQLSSQFQYLTLVGVAGRSPVPFHPGAIRYFRERGVEGF